MSNIVPQSAGLNTRSWLALENAHRNIVTSTAHDIEEVWVISGTIFEDGQAQTLIVDGVGVPESCYKVITWRDGSGDLQARGYVLGQLDTSTSPLTQYLITIDAIEEATGLDFLPDLEDAEEDALEAATHADLWGQ